jgi:hypothetical protein
MQVNPLLIKLGFKDDSLKSLSQMSDDELASLIPDIISDDAKIGSWTLVHDIRETDIPTWRIAAEVRPVNIKGLSWFDKNKDVVCLDVEGAAVFIGR